MAELTRVAAINVNLTPKLQAKQIEILTFRRVIATLSEALGIQLLQNKVSTGQNCNQPDKLIREGQK